MKNYFKTIRNGEKLERRTVTEWKEKGTKEEMIELITFQKRKNRNNAIAGIVSAVALCIVIDKTMTE